MNKIRFFDLFIFTMLAIVSEFLSTFCFQKMSSGFYLSFAFLIFIIASIRWGWWSIVCLIFSGIPLVFLQPIGLLEGFFYYCVGNVLAVLPILIYWKRDRNKIAKNYWLLFGYVLAVLICLSFSKGIVMIILNQDYLGFYHYFVSMLLTFAISYIVLFVFVRFRTNLVIDMEKYLIEENKEKGDDRYDERVNQNEGTQDQGNSSGC